MKTFTQKIPGCYLNDHATGKDTSQLELEEQLTAILKRISFYGNALLNITPRGLGERFT